MTNRILLMMALATFVACSSEPEAPDMDYLCTAQPKMKPFCGLQSPEDMEWLPDGSGMLVSEYGSLGKFLGRISLLNHHTGETTVLHDSKTEKAAANEQEWGASNSVQQDKFSPHGIGLAQRADGRWQLLVVNHADQETIDFFELLQTEDGQWRLQWRGSVDADDDSLFNDVAAAGDGFYTTRFYQKGSVYNSAKDYYFGRANGHVKKWTPSQGWKILEGTKGVLLNGILWNERAGELVVCEWGSEKVNVFNGEGEKKYDVELSFPDNVSWNANRDAYLVPSKSGSFYKTAKCVTAGVEVCKGAFEIYEINPETREATLRYSNEGEFYAAPSNAIERDGKLYIGSFLGSRMLMVE